MWAEGPDEEQRKSVSGVETKTLVNIMIKFLCTQKRKGNILLVYS